jgi:hypothetical protein
MARLDRLGTAKKVAQIGAVIGREFSHALLVAVARTPEAELQSALDRLTTTGLLFRQGVPPRATYLFKHALVQDAAYGTLLREPRRALHARIAETPESQFTEIAENQPELLAHHCTEAGQTPEYLALNQEGKVPTLLVGGRPLTEVAAILYYLARRYPESRLWPDGDLEAEAQVISWMSFISATVQPSRLQGIERAREVFGIADARVGNREWVVGIYSIADIHLFRVYWRFLIGSIERPRSFQIWVRITIG